MGIICSNFIQKASYRQSAGGREVERDTYTHGQSRKWQSKFEVDSRHRNRKAKEASCNVSNWPNQMRASPSALPHAPKLSESTHIMGVICSGTRHRQQEGGVEGGQTVCVCFPVERYKYDEATAAEAAYNLSTHVCALRVGVSVCLPLFLSLSGMCYKDIGTHTHIDTHIDTVQALVTWPNRHFVILWILIPLEAVTWGPAPTSPQSPSPLSLLPCLSCSYVSSWWRYGYFSCHSKCVRAARRLQARAPFTTLIPPPLPSPSAAAPAW